MAMTNDYPEGTEFVTLIATFGTGAMLQRAIVVLPVAQRLFADPTMHPLIRRHLIASVTKSAAKVGVAGTPVLEWFHGDGTLDPSRAFLLNRELKPLPWRDTITAQ